MYHLNITDAAAGRIADICKENGKNAADGTTRLRIAVQGGGCSGFQYTFLMDEEQLSDDHVFSHNDAHVILDESSLSLLSGSTLDYQDDLAASMFVLKNPKATGGCGCGNSFSI